MRIHNYYSKVRNTLLLLSWLLLLLPARADSISVQYPEIKISLDTNKLMIGAQTVLHIQAKIPDNVRVLWPQIGDTITKEVEVIHKGTIDTLTSGNTSYTTLQQNITISAFDSGYFVIPPLRLYYEMNGSYADTSAAFAESNALLLEVHTVKVDLQKPIKDIKPIKEEPLHFSEILPWILLGLGILLALALGIYIYLRLKNNKPIIPLPQVPKDPPHIAALKKLKLLKEQKLWQKGAVKEFYSELTDIMREYMERQMGFGAMEMVSQDIMEQLKEQQLPEDLLKSTEEVLQTADLVKFAKMEPLSDENDRALKWGFDFVEATKPAPKADSINDVEPEKTQAL